MIYHPAQMADGLAKDWKELENSYRVKVTRKRAWLPVVTESGIRWLTLVWRIETCDIGASGTVQYRDKIWQSSTSGDQVPT
jgi:hypothetical protein